MGYIDSLAAVMVPSSVLYRQLKTANAKIAHSEGVYLFDEHGGKIVDASGGAAVSCIGHNQKRVHKAIVNQLEKVEYAYSYFFTTPVAEELARVLTESTGGHMSRVFIVSSGKFPPGPKSTSSKALLTLSCSILGTEAVEAAMKMARQYFCELQEPQRKRTRFIAREQSYHGNTLGSLSISGHPPRRALYEEMLSKNVSHVSSCNPYRGMTAGDTSETYVARLARELDDEFKRVGPDTVCAFIAETVCGSVCKS